MSNYKKLQTMFNLLFLKNKPPPPQPGCGVPPPVIVLYHCPGDLSSPFIKN